MSFANYIFLENSNISVHLLKQELLPGIPLLDNILYDMAGTTALHLLVLKFCLHIELQGPVT